MEMIFAWMCVIAIQLEVEGGDVQSPSPKIPNEGRQRAVLADDDSAQFFLYKPFLCH